MHSTELRLFYNFCRVKASIFSVVDCCITIENADFDTFGVKLVNYPTLSSFKIRLLSNFSSKLAKFPYSQGTSMTIYGLKIDPF